MEPWETGRCQPAASGSGAWGEGSRCKHQPHTCLCSQTHRGARSERPDLTSHSSWAATLAALPLPALACHVDLFRSASQLLLDPEHLGQPAGSLGRLALIVLISGPEVLISLSLMSAMCHRNCSKRILQNHSWEEKRHCEQDPGLFLTSWPGSDEKYSEPSCLFAQTQKRERDGYKGI